jgi:predicted Zn-dependent protease
MKTNIRRSLPAVLLVAALCEFGYAQNINQGQINFVSIEKEIELGRQLSQEVERQITLIDDASINEYVTRLGRKIAGNSDVTMPTTFKVTTSRDFDAFTLPGGYVYVNAGLILDSANEAELASVIAYQIAHVAARHATEMQSKAELVNFAGIPLVFMGGAAGTLSFRQGAAPAHAQFLQFHRKNVNEADALGVQYLHKTGYDPNSAVATLRKVQALDGSNRPSTHPSPSDRITAVQKTIDNLPGITQSVITDSPEFQSTKARVAGIMNR